MAGLVTDIVLAIESIERKWAFGLVKIDQICLGWHLGTLSTAKYEFATLQAGVSALVHTAWIKSAPVHACSKGLDPSLATPLIPSFPHQGSIAHRNQGQNNTRQKHQRRYRANA